MEVGDRKTGRIIRNLRTGIIGTDHHMTRGTSGDRHMNTEIREDLHMTIETTGHHPMSIIDQGKGAPSRIMVKDKGEDHNITITGSMNGAQYPRIIITPR